jgi:hypothetical protein
VSTLWLDVAALVGGVEAACGCFTSCHLLHRAALALAPDPVPGCGGRDSVVKTLVDGVCSRCGTVVILACSTPRALAWFARNPSKCIQWTFCTPFVSAVPCVTVLLLLVVVG